MCNEMPTAHFLHINMMTFPSINTDCFFILLLLLLGFDAMMCVMLYRFEPTVSAVDGNKLDFFECARERRSEEQKSTKLVLTFNRSLPTGS